MIGLSSIMSWAMAFTEIPDMIATAILGLATNKYLILLLMHLQVSSLHMVLQDLPYL